jgi:SAM-dependent methyltransferase
VATELNAELVRTAYRLFLGREPESELAVRQALTHGTLEELRAAFLVSAEFRGVVQSDLPPPPAPTLVPLGAPPIAVEWQADDETAAALLAHVMTTWTRLGEERPHWSVLSAQPFAPERIAANEAAFFGSGAQDRDDLVAILARQGVRPDAVPRLFEFGCGLGRVTAHFAKTFASVAACDVSASHMRLARETLAKAGVAADLALAQTADFGMTAPFDLWFSRIVLQHNPPPIIAMILRRAFALLAPGGFAVFQVPTYAAGYRFRLADYLAGLGGADGIEMHVLPQPVVFALAREAGCETLEVLEDLSAGPPATWRSTTFVLRKLRTDLPA